MENTLRMFKTINDIQLNKYTYEELSEQYKSDKSPQIIANLFVRLYDLICTFKPKFFFIDEQDLSSISIKAINDSLLKYDASKNVPYVSYYCSFLNMCLLYEFKNIKCDKRKINHFASLRIMPTEDNELNDSAFDSVLSSPLLFDYDMLTDIAIDTSTELTDKEKVLCKYIAHNPTICTKSEMTDILEVSRPTFYKRLKILKEKLTLILDQ